MNKSSSCIKAPFLREGFKKITIFERVAKRGEDLDGFQVSEGGWEERGWVF